jgi:hypothetical protein
MGGWQARLIFSVCGSQITKEIITLQAGPDHRRVVEGKTMSHDWAANVKKYVPNANEAAIHGIIRHLGIALQRQDASFVACTDKAERDRVRDGFLKKKLGLSLSDADLDRAIMDICQQMHGDRDKPRVTFYYLLAEKFGKLPNFT